MVDQKKIAGIFTDFLGLYTGKLDIGIRALCEKYERHPVLMGLLSHTEDAVELEVPKAMKEIYAFYKEYRGRDLQDKDWKMVVENVRQMILNYGENPWFRRVALEIVNLLEDDDREKRQLAKEVEREMAEAEQEAEERRAA